jgi:hypothetical protein
MGSRSAAQELALPIDVEQGLVFHAAEPRTPYVFAVRVEPALDWGRMRVGAILGPAYRNPSWDFALGGRLSWFALTLSHDLGLRVALQAEYLPVQGSLRASAGLLGELLGLMRIGVWPAYDFEAQRMELGVSIGLDVLSWRRVLKDDL